MKRTLLFLRCFLQPCLQEHKPTRTIKETVGDQTIKKSALKPGMLVYDKYAKCPKIIRWDMPDFKAI